MTKNCTKGYGCGDTCIEKRDDCHDDNLPQSVNRVASDYSRAAQSLQGRRLKASPLRQVSPQGDLKYEVQNEIFARQVEKATEDAAKSSEVRYEGYMEDAKKGNPETLRRIEAIEWGGIENSFPADRDKAAIGRLEYRLEYSLPLDPAALRQPIADILREKIKERTGPEEDVIEELKENYKSAISDRMDQDGYDLEKYTRRAQEKIDRGDFDGAEEELRTSEKIQDYVSYDYPPEWAQSKDLPGDMLEIANRVRNTWLPQDREVFSTDWESLSLKIDDLRKTPEERERERITEKRFTEFREKIKREKDKLEFIVEGKYDLEAGLRGQLKREYKELNRRIYEGDDSEETATAYFELGRRRAKLAREEDAAEARLEHLRKTFIADLATEEGLLDDLLD